jgi:hypothetical protein
MDQGARLRRRIREELGRRRGSFNKGKCVKKLSFLFLVFKSESLGDGFG